MLYALDSEGQKIKALPKSTGLCPDCGDSLIAKCGDIVMWHWAHKSGGDCEVWSEPEGQWHLWWKSLWPKEYVEVPIVKNGKRHRADIKTDRGLVIELQHSSISTDEIRERERFYDNMVWIFDQIDASTLGSISFTERNSKNMGTYFYINWKHPRKTMKYLTKKTYLDICDGLMPYSSNMFLLNKFEDMDRIVFDREFLSGSNPPEVPFGWGYAYCRKMFLIWNGNRV